MKNSNCLFKIVVTLLALIVYSVFLFQPNDSKHIISQPTTIEQQDVEKSKEDSLNTARANILLFQKDSTIQVLKSKLENERANLANQKAEANKQHLLNDSLRLKFKENKNLSACEDLVNGLDSEIIEKDSVIESLVSTIDNYSSEVKLLEDKVDIQECIIISKQSLIASKDSTITFYKTQKRKFEFWDKVKIKVASAMILIETIGLTLK